MGPDPDPAYQLSPSPPPGFPDYTGGMAVSDPPFTRRDYERLPEGFPAQLVHGALVKEPAPLPWHQVLVQRIQRELGRVLDPDLVLASPVDVVLDDRNVYQPDVVVLPRPVRPADRRVPLPVAVFEVLSPATAETDRGPKRAAYLAAGVREVWIVDPEAGVVERHTPGEARVSRAGERLASKAMPGLSLVPGELFAG